MSEVETRAPARAALSSGASAPQQATGPARAMLGAGSENGSFGRALAAAREARGLSQADVAAQLRLHKRQIKAIEEEDLAALPEGPFVRGYVRNFARLVDLPAEPLLSLLNAASKPTDPLHGNGGGAATVGAIQRPPRESLSGDAAGRGDDVGRRGAGLAVAGCACGRAGKSAGGGHVGACDRRRNRRGAVISRTEPAIPRSVVGGDPAG
jgi:hypothetical protein